MEKDRAILIRRFRLTETSLIIHWCALEHGLIKTVAKGARNPRNRFYGNLDLFYEAEIEFVRSRAGDLHTLRDLAVTAPHFGIRTSYPRTLAASYFVRLLEVTCERETSVGDLYDLFRRALGYLEANEPDSRAILHFESEMARTLGIRSGPRPPIESLRDACHRIPEQRAELFSLLGDPSG